MFEKILVPLDGSKVAAGVLRYAAWLGKGLGARVTLLTVADPSDSESREHTADAL